MPECMVHSHRKSKCSCEDKMNQLVWNNQFILNDGKSLYYAFFHNTCRLSKVGDLVFQDNIFLGSGKNLRSTFPLIISGQCHTEWMAFSPSWEKCLCWTLPPPPPSYPFIENCFQVPIGGKVFDLSSISKYFPEISVPEKKFLRLLRLN